MRTHLGRIQPVAIFVLALLGVWSCRAEATAPRAPLLAALRAVIADSLQPHAVASGRQFAVETDTDGTWARALATAPPPRSARQATLVLQVGRAELHPDSAIVHARLVGCTPQMHGMNFYVHIVRLRFLRADGIWRYRGLTTETILDGGC